MLSWTREIQSVLVQHTARSRSKKRQATSGCFVQTAGCVLSGEPTALLMFDFSIFDVISSVSTTLSLVRMWWKQVKCIRLVSATHRHTRPPSTKWTHKCTLWAGLEGKERWMRVRAFEAFHHLHSGAGDKTVNSKMQHLPSQIYYQQWKYHKHYYSTVYHICDVTDLQPQWRWWKCLRQVKTLRKTTIKCSTYYKLHAFTSSSCYVISVLNVKWQKHFVFEPPAPPFFLTIGAVCDWSLSSHSFAHCFLNQFLSNRCGISYCVSCEALTYFSDAPCEGAADSDAHQCLCECL